MDFKYWSRFSVFILSGERINNSRFFFSILFKYYRLNRGMSFPLTVPICMPNNVKKVRIIIYCDFIYKSFLHSLTN